MKKWIQEETEGNRFGDKRLNRRLVKIADRFSMRPMESVPGACGDWAETHGAYRFFDHERVSPHEILAGHTRQTLGRMKKQEVVLCVGDTTFLNHAGSPCTEGMGPHTDHGEHGYFVHPLVAFSPEGQCWGTLDFQSWARTGKKTDKQERSKRPIEEKESRCWVRDVERCNQLGGETPQTKLVYVADRDSDVYEVLSTPRRENVEWLIRVVHNRKTSQGQTMRTVLDKEAWQAQAEVRVPARPGQMARIAQVSIRWSSVELAGPRRVDRVLPEVRAQVVQVLELAPPAGAVPVEWRLLTTCPVQTLAQAQEVVAWYRGRWKIENFFRVLKTGCRVESLQLQTRQRLEVAVAIYFLITWRILFLQHSSRLSPDQPATVLLSQLEWTTLWTVTQKTEPPTQPPTLEVAIKWIAQLGGFLARNSDGPPGPQTLWLGWRRLSDFIISRLAFNPTCVES